MESLQGTPQNERNIAKMCKVSYSKVTLQSQKRQLRLRQNRSKSRRTGMAISEADAATCSTSTALLSLTSSHWSTNLPLYFWICSQVPHANHFDYCFLPFWKSQAGKFSSFFRDLPTAAVASVFFHRLFDGDRFVHQSVVEFRRISFFRNMIHVVLPARPSLGKHGTHGTTHFSICARASEITLKSS